MHIGHYAAAVVVAIGGCLASFSAAATKVNDACRAQLPKSLVLALGRTYPGFDLPLLTDNQQFDIEFNRRHGGLGCLGVATGDFDGNGKPEFALALKARNKPDAVVVVAILDRSDWSFQKIYSSADRNRLYVAVVPAGSYDNAPNVSGEPTLQRQHEALQCPHSGILTGATQAPGIVFCLVPRGKSDKAGWEQVSGMLHCVHQVPNGATVTANGDVTLNGVIIDHSGPCPNVGVLTSGPYPGAGGLPHRPLIHNERVVVLDVRLAQGDSSPITPDNEDTVILFLEGGQIRTVDSLGHASIAMRSFGDAVLIPKGTDAIDTLVAGGPAHEIMISLKDHRVPPIANSSGYPTAFPRVGATKVLDNSRFTVWHYSWTKGEPTGMHFHDKDFVVAFRYDSVQSILTPDGTSHASPVKAGDIFFLERGLTHSEELTTDRQSAVYLELKN